MKYRYTFVYKVKSESKAKRCEHSDMRIIKALQAMCKEIADLEYSKLTRNYR